MKSSTDSDRRSFMKFVAAAPLACWAGRSVRGESTVAGTIAPPGAVNAAPFSEVERWGMQEIPLKASKVYANPFADVSLTCRFQLGDFQQTVQGFYDGENNWKVRFMPPAEGWWTFETISSDPELSGQRGEFRCVPAGPKNHGPVVVRDAHHFGYADGSSYFCLGTTLYNWVHREASLQQQTLDTLQSNAFNKVRFCIFPKWHPFNHVEPPLYPYEKNAAGDFDFDRFNPDYFRHVERRILDLQALGIEADLILFHGYDHWGFSKMDPAHDDAYLRYLIARLAGFRNVWWTMANEWDFVQPPKNWDHIFQVVQAQDPSGHLRGIHNGRVWYDHAKPWVTHCVIQMQGGDTHATALGAREKYGKPVLVDEYGYEGNNTMSWGDLTAREETDRHWGIAMAGAYGSHGETYVHPGDILWWAVGGKLVGESPARLAFLKQVMTESPFEEMETLPDAVRPGAALGKKGSHYLLWFLDFDWEQPITVELDGEGSYEAELIDPWVMKVYPLGRTTAGKQTFTLHLAPSVLRFKRATGAAATPASQSPMSLAELIARWEANPA